MGENVGMLRCCCVDSPVGKLCLAAEGEALVGLWMEEQRFFGAPYGALPRCGEADGVLTEAVAWLDAYWAGRMPDPAVLPLALRGTPFRQRVWQTLLRIPYGETRSYGELAVQLGSSPRAVGGAVGHNSICIIIPCHRVTGAGGELKGYAGGTARQRLILELECLHADARNQHEAISCYGAELPDKSPFVRCRTGR